MILKKIVYYSVLTGLMVSLFTLSVSFNSDLNILKFANASDDVPTIPEAGGADLPPLTTVGSSKATETIQSNTVVDSINPNTPSVPDAGFSSSGVSTKKTPIIPITDTAVISDNNWQLLNPNHNNQNPKIDPIENKPTTENPVAIDITKSTSISPSKINQTPRTGGLEVLTIIFATLVSFGVWYYYKHQHSKKSDLNISEKKI